MIELTLHPQLPTNRPAIQRENDRLNVLRIYGGNAVDIIVSGVGTVDVYLWCGPAGWRKHPQGSQLEDNGSYHRLVLGRLLSTDTRYLLVVSMVSVRVWAQGVEY